MIYGHKNSYEEKINIKRKVNGIKKINKGQVLEIKESYFSKGRTQKEIASLYKVNPSVISRICSGKIYKQFFRSTLCL